MLGRYVRGGLRFSLSRSTKGVDTPITQHLGYESISERVRGEHGLQLLAPGRNANSKGLVEVGRRKNGISGAAGWCRILFGRYGNNAVSEQWHSIRSSDHPRKIRKYSQMATRFFSSSFHGRYKRNRAKHEFTHRFCCR